jgi:hypothetical protein
MCSTIQLTSTTKHSTIDEPSPIIKFTQSNWNHLCPDMMREIGRFLPVKDLIGSLARINRYLHSCVNDIAKAEQRRMGIISLKTSLRGKSGLSLQPQVISARCLGTCRSPNRKKGKYHALQTNLQKNPLQIYSFVISLLDEVKQALNVKDPSERNKALYRIIAKKIDLSLEEALAITDLIPKGNEYHNQALFYIAVCIKDLSPQRALEIAFQIPQENVWHAQTLVHIANTRNDLSLEQKRVVQLPIYTQIT